VKFNHCRAVVSGGASGLGLAVVQQVIKYGGMAVMLDVQAERGKAMADSLGDNALFIETDVAQESSVDRAVNQAADFLKGISLAVNCAGIAPSRRVLAKDGLMSTADFAKVININLVGTFSVCRAVANLMQHNEPEGQDQERGIIINTASIAAIEGQIGQAAYSASKGGVASMALPLAREFARIGVRVMTIAPGLFETPMFDTLPVEAREVLATNTPYPHRLGKPEEFALLVQQIYENPMLNGELIRLDGALRMQPK
jgi:NAD(P)-dependent dehydrogenase (short-subunit alcohol dehydrogenase family)